ncbi:hypothetical protein N9T80_00610 [bacterium]|nr:hypothetical protein [bacterium]
MLKYTLKRLLSFIPMIIAISLIAFIISINAPGDPVESLTKSAGNEGGAEKQSGTAKKDKQKLRKKLGLDLPLFYFSISDLAYCDTLYKIQDRDQRENLESLIHEFGNWKSIDLFYKKLLTLQKKHQNIDIQLICEKDTSLDKNTINESLNQIGFNIVGLLEENKKNIVDSKYENLNLLVLGNDYFPSLKEPYLEVIKLKNNLSITKTKWKTYIPSINWYGINSQYHWWVFGGENLSDFTQDNPIIGSEDPNQSMFDASLIYAPINGRMFYTGFRFKIK